MKMKVVFYFFMISQDITEKKLNHTLQQGNIEN